MGGRIEGVGLTRHFGCGLLILFATVRLPVLYASQGDFDERWRWVLFDRGHGLPSNEIVSLVESSDGTVWAATTRGLAFYDGFNWQRVDEIEPPGAPTTVFPDASGGLLVLVDGKIYRGGRAGFSPITIPEHPTSFRIKSVAETTDRLLFSTDECEFLELRSTELLALPRLPGTPGKGYDCSIVADGEEFWAMGHLGLFQLIGGRNWKSRVQYPVQGLLRDGDSSLAISVGQPGSEGLFRVPMTGRPLMLPGESRHLITAAGIGTAGQIIVADTTGGIRLRENGRWRRLDPVPLPLRSVSLFHYQKNGDIWVAVPDGLYLHRTSIRRWGRWRAPVDDPGAQQVNTLILSRTGDLLAATGGGILRVKSDGTRGFISEAAGTSLITVTGLAEDPNGDLWASSGGTFIGAIRFRNGEARRFGAEDGLADARFHRILPDRSGNIWFLGHSVPGEDNPGNVGAFRFDGQEFTHFGPREGVPASPVYDFQESEGGSLWFATVSGLARRKEGAWTYWTIDEGLRTDRVFSLAIDDAGVVWFSHQRESKGLGFIDAAGQVGYIDQQGGLPTENIWDLAHRPGGGLWMTSARGLLLMRDQSFTEFGLSGGLAHPRLWPLLHTADSVLVGSIGGGVYQLFLEEALHPAPKVVARPPAINGDDAVLRWDAFAYRGEMPPQNVAVRYRLDDDDWSEWNRDREASFLNLSPGVHSFEIQSRSLFGNEGAPAKSGPFTIAAPFYQHPAFLAAVTFWTITLIVAAMLYWRRQQESQLILEAKVRKRTALLERANLELSSANLELEAFSYSVSHDLRAPLRSINGFSQILEEDYGRKLDSAGLQHLDRIRKASVRMARLIDDLLELSRVSRVEFDPQEVDLSSIAAETASNLRRAHSDRRVRFHISSGLTVNGDDRLLRVALQNLMDNAWKFTRTRDVTEITLGFDGRKQAYYVRDNGVGFDMEHAAKLFQPFERLSGAESFEGTGIGLATVSRIISRHGGRIWAQSRPEVGSTFYFTLPERRASPGSEEAGKER